MDIFTRTTANCFGPYGLNCPCCDNGFSNKRKAKSRKNLLSQKRRAILKVETRREISLEID